MFKCIIIDDEPYAVNVLKNYVKAIPFLKLVNIYTDPLLALREISNGIMVDFVFLDINMPRLSGIDLALAIKNKTRHIVYSTSHREHAYSAFESGADAYLLKPYDLNKFSVTLNKLISGYSTDELAEDYFLIKSSKDMIIKKIKYNEIYAIESMQNYIKIHLSQQVVVTYMSLNEILNTLIMKSGFTQIHRSFIVSLKFIETINGNIVELSNGLKFNVGAKYRKKISEYIALNLITSSIKKDNKH